MQDRELAARLGSQNRPTSVRDYAKSRGWETVAPSRRRLWIFSHPKGGLRQPAVPMDRDRGWTDALWEVILRIAEMEDLPPDTVGNNILTADSDVVRFRVSGEGASNGMLPITDATGLIKQGARIGRVESVAGFQELTSKNAPQG